MARHPPDILITTPESLFLVLTSQARALLASVEIVIVDEIHALVGTKRGAHLALCLERLQEAALRPLQRVGLSATQRPLEEVARYLGGGEGVRTWKGRPVTIVDAGARKAFDLRVEVPVEDMKHLGEVQESSPDDAAKGPLPFAQRRSIWPAIHPRLLEMVRAHRSTLIFVNSRRLAERLATALNEQTVDELSALVRRAGPFSALPRAQFEGVLDMLAGRYPSDEFAELRPRVTWDRLRGTVRAREGVARLVFANAGTIPDRGLYGVFLADAEGSGRRVGELDEEMVFESRVGEVFVLGASSWRITEITRDRVLVVPAPGEPGKTPFWKADRGARPVELGRAIGRLTRELAAAPRAKAVLRLRDLHGLDERAAENLLAYLEEQREATGALPDDRTLVLERTRDEMGDWRLCLLSPFGGRVHAPWSMALEARLRAAGEAEVETIWSDDGIVVRLPERERPPDAEALLPEPEEIEGLVVGALGQTSLFAAHFREAAGRALLLPRRRPGQRSPLWMQRKRAADLLGAAARYPSFPILLEAYRECLKDVFDLPALVDLARRVRAREERVLAGENRESAPLGKRLDLGGVRI